MNLLGGFRTQHREQPTEGAVGGRGLGVKACAAAVDQVAAQFAIESTKAPTLQLLEQAAAQKAIGSDTGAAVACPSGATTGQAVAEQIDQQGVVQEVIYGFEQIVLPQGGLPGQGEIEEPGLVLGRGEHDYSHISIRHLSREK